MVLPSEAHELSVGQRLGVRLREVRTALEHLPVVATPSAHDWDALSASWRDELDQRIEQLRRLRDDLDGCIGCGCLSTTRCPVVNSEDHLGRRGPGARALDVRLAEE